MAKLSDIIEDFIKDLIDDTDGTIIIQRNELAHKFNCVPSQINYVISTRFSNARGYHTESRRGGGGGITISRITTSASDYIMHIISSMGNRISQQSIEIFIKNFIDYNIVNPQEALLIKSATSDKALSLVTPNERDLLRASILKNMLISLAITR
jgi:transcriptional regulator CtsR